jgi:hypothetical protein
MMPLFVLWSIYMSCKSGTCIAYDVVTVLNTNNRQSADYMTRNLQHLSEDFEKMRSYVEENLTPAAAMIRQSEHVLET